MRTSLTARVGLKDFKLMNLTDFQKAIVDDVLAKEKSTQQHSESGLGIQIGTLSNFKLTTRNGQSRIATIPGAQIAFKHSGKIYNAAAVKIHLPPTALLTESATEVDQPHSFHGLTDNAIRLLPGVLEQKEAIAFLAQRKEAKSRPKQITQASGQDEEDEDMPSRERAYQGRRVRGDPRMVGQAILGLLRQAWTRFKEGLTIRQLCHFSPLLESQPRDFLRQLMDQMSEVMQNGDRYELTDVMKAAAGTYQKHY
eukprot:gnl/Dysnectes_brevis/3741_a4801_1073.p1 GENE.gnl/Dysnectes_brevis/3741_a4801_1073~~gnl/Dysnectes_brevis/3741_a4801_1073.p1  ORF type:complete len:254 (-),score=43.01 gnl/Dysnectes_brevis/3741_a4801_1073:32-793(-)